MPQIQPSACACWLMLAYCNYDIDEAYRSLKLTSSSELRGPFSYAPSPLASKKLYSGTIRLKGHHS